MTGTAVMALVIKAQQVHLLRILENKDIVPFFPISFLSVINLSLEDCKILLFFATEKEKYLVPPGIDPWTSRFAVCRSPTELIRF